MAEKFQLVSNFRGYVNKKDLTNLEPGYLISGSQNVLSNDGEKIAIREGYTLDGAASTAETPIRSSYEWTTHRGEERPLRLYDDELEYRYNDAWYRLANGFGTSVTMNFAEFWDNSELQDLLLFVDGTSNIYMWSGAITTLSSVAAATITKSGSTTWSEDGFLTTGTRQVILGGITYTYTGGESTTTLTGVSPNPTLGGHAAGDVIHQAIRTTANSAMTSISSTFSNDLISVLNNQVYIASLESRFVYVSAQNSYTDYSFSSPRTPAQGALITLDGAVVGFDPPTPDEENGAMRVSAGKDYWYTILFQLSADLTKEASIIRRLITGPNQAAQSQALIAKIKNKTVFVSNEPTLDELGRVENINTSESRPISDAIKVDFDDYDFTNAHIKYWKNNIYIALPNEGKVLLFNIEKRYWEPPQILPVRRLAIIEGHLYGHSSSVAETYKLFDPDVYNDNTNPIEAIAAFSYQNYGTRSELKTLDEVFTEGYIATNTDLTLIVKYDFGGFTSIQEFTIEGDDDSILFSTTADGSLGKNPIGSQPIGSITDSLSGLAKFRQIDTAIRQDFFEVQYYYTSNDVDFQWEILSFGGNPMLSKSKPTSIKK